MQAIEVRCKTDRYFAIIFFMTAAAFIFAVYLYSVSDSGEKPDWQIVGIFLLVEIPAWIWYLHLISWRLSFEPDTGNMTYCSLFCRKTNFHVSEVETELYSNEYRGGSCVKKLMLSTETISVYITLGAYDKGTIWERMQGGDMYAPELVRFLRENGKLDTIKHP